MKLDKNDYLTNLSGRIQSVNDIDFFNKLIDIYQVLFIDRYWWLTKREREFYICCLIISNKGYTYTSQEAKQIFKDVYNLKRDSEKRIHLKSLEQKNFLVSDVKTKKINLPPFFTIGVDNNHLLKLDIEISKE